jgi:hypothetical protein
MGTESKSRDETIKAIVATFEGRIGVIGILRIVLVRGRGSIAATRRPGRRT